jgi:plastocyanin
MAQDFLHCHWLAPLALLALTLAQPATAARSVSGSVTAPQGAAIAGAVVFLQEPSSPPTAGEHADAVVDQVEKTFVPGILPIMVGTYVRFPNHDQIQHHVYSFSPTKTFELPLYKGEAAPAVLFDKVGVVKIGCNIHDWMSGIILVLPTPHFTVTDASGKYVLENVPEGNYTLVVWHAQSNVKPEDTAREIPIREEVTNVNFTLALSPGRLRPAVHGSRADP